MGCFYQCCVCGVKQESPDFKTPQTMVEIKTNKGTTIEISFQCKEHEREDKCKQ